ncbi:hypothetical protein DAPPUDRAFT_310544 [Daphnia pulex]|uniref:Uncharacterized protein n=1 Tax=Daphnia pulex TaxID=6669 RepID=E9FTZ1_DAPPU|nr:hypothetical protein DAPPUDRAFT_310544 [Daphnia pulex]|eukprot:EFX89450.1 hypothetical protein DAPPUDRAFT_310544 [Daphnia pulex]
MDQRKSWLISENDYKEAKIAEVKEYTENKQGSVAQKSPQSDNFAGGNFPNLLETGQNKQIANQLPPEEFLPEDVKLLQRMNRVLHVDNIKKTMVCVKLEKDYNHLKGINKISEIERENEKRREESNLLLQNALDEISSHQLKSENSKACKLNLADLKLNEDNPNDIPERQKLIKELRDLKYMYEKLQRKETQGRRQLQIYEEKYQYFEDVVHNSSIYLDESKKQLDASLSKIKMLESELETWKNNCFEYEELALVQHNRQLQNEIQSEPNASSQRTRNQLDPTFINIFKYLKPKGNPN